MISLNKVNKINLGKKDFTIERRTEVAGINDSPKIYDN